jgi:hypothetical protein
MYNFGRRPPRALDSFGIAGLLGEECHIFYDNLFTTRHVGRISDLLSARLKRAGPDELRLRAMILFSVFEAYRTKAKVDPRSPMTVEVGIDAEKIAVGVGFRLPLGIKTEGIPDRIESGEPEGPFEELIFDLDSQADQVVLRLQPKTGRIELVALMGIVGKMDATALSEKKPVEVVSFDEPQEAPTAKFYIQLGDMDYPQLLRDDAPGKNLPGISTGRVLAKTATEEVIRISGTTQKIKDDIIKIAGSGSAETQDQTVFKVSGTEGYIEKIKELEARIAELEEDAGDDGDSEGVTERVGGLFKKVWPFRKSEADEPSEEEKKEEAQDADDEEPVAEASDEGEEDSNEEQEEAKESSAKKKSKNESDDESKKQADATESAANNLIVEISGGRLDRTLAKAQKEATEIAKDSRAKKWVDGLMEELVQEKSRLHEMAKKLNQSIRQKEFSFRNQLQGMQEELRRRDDMIKQKNSALSRTKDQLAQANINMERVKSSTSSSGDDAHYKQKYTLNQKVLETVKNENELLRKKNDEIKLKLDQLSVKTRGPSFQDLQAMQQKAERLQRQLEEFKRSNAALNEKVNELQSAKKAKAGDPDDLKKRLDASVKIATIAQKESDQLRLRVEELQVEDGRLKKELEKAYADLKALKTKAGAVGGGGTPPKAA